MFEPRALSGAIPVFMMSPVFGFVISFASLYGLSIGVENAGLFFTITAISMILMRISSRAYMDRVAPLKIFGVAAVCGIVTFALFLAAPSNLVLFNAAGAFYGVCLGVSMPVAQSVAVKSSPSHRWGATNALFLFMMDVGFGLGTALWGTLNDAFGFPGDALVRDGLHRRRLRARLLHVPQARVDAAVNARPAPPPPQRKRSPSSRLQRRHSRARPCNADALLRAAARRGSRKADLQATRSLHSSCVRTCAARSHARAAHVC